MAAKHTCAATYDNSDPAGTVVNADPNHIVSMLRILIFAAI